MFIYNSLSGKKEDLEKALGDTKKVRLFVCGPTVYDFAHLGHARVAIFFDLAKRYLESRGYKVQYLQNITDIDDKIIDRAHRENQSPKELARFYEREYLANMKELGVKSVDKYPRASDHLREIIKQIKGLMEKGFAYKTSSGVYFEIKKFPDYGKLSKQNLDELRPGWRIEPDPEKKDPLDFSLWKFKKHDYEPSWKSPWGEGRPGWHIEDTAMTEKYFGPQYDLHGGGLDLKFPHHESEIAQQESASGLKPFVKIWMHVGLVLSNGEKMSKSLKNFVTIKDFLSHHSATALKLIMHRHKHGSPLDYQESLIINANKNLDSMSQFLAKLKMANASKPAQVNLEKYDQEFNAKMEDDFNTPEALAVIFNFVSDTNKNIWELGKKEAKMVGKWLLDKLRLFTLQIKFPKIPLKIRALAKKRELFRSSKQFVQSDVLRKEIEALGYTIEDTPNGPFLWPKSQLN